MKNAQNTRSKPEAAVPGILERLHLRVTVVAVRRLEQQIVIGVGIERRIEIDEIDALVFDVLTQNGKIVAIKKACCGRVSCALRHSHPENFPFEIYPARLKHAGADHCA